MPHSLIKRSLGHMHILLIELICESPFASVSTAIHVQYFTRGERGVGEKQSCVDDFFDLADSANRVQPFEEVMTFRFMHRSIDHSRRYGVYTNALFRVFNGEGACHRIQG